MHAQLGDEHGREHLSGQLGLHDALSGVVAAMAAATPVVLVLLVATLLAAATAVVAIVTVVAVLALDMASLGLWLLALLGLAVAGGRGLVVRRLGVLVLTRATALGLRGVLGLLGHAGLLGTGGLRSSRVLALGLALTGTTALWRLDVLVLLFCHVGDPSCLANFSPPGTWQDLGTGLECDRTWAKLSCWGHGRAPTCGANGSFDPY